MRIAIWGAGNIGTAVCYRLALLEGVSEIHWINQTFDEIQLRSIDVEHGLAFAPTCRRVHPWPQDAAPSALAASDLLVVTLGAPVPPGAGRDEVLKASAKAIRESVVPALKDFRGIILVVTNPVDVIAWLVASRLKGENPSRVIGLGTIVDTARLRAAVSKYVTPPKSAREMTCLAVGTHDGNVVGVPGVEQISPTLFELARLEVVAGAERVKGTTKRGERLASRSPVAEGVAQVVRAVVSDSHSTLCVSTSDPSTAEGLYYSVPTMIGRQGVVTRHGDVIDVFAEKFEACRTEMRRLIKLIE